MNTHVWILFHSRKDKTKWRILKNIPPAALLQEFVIDCVVATATSDDLVVGNSAAPWSK